MSDVTVCLVHGAWHGAWCWEAITPILDAAEVRHAEVELPFTGHDDDVAATRAFLDDVAGAKVLVGHSYGGLVISGAAEGRSDIDHLVYLCAFMVPEGQTVFDLIGAVPDLPHAKVFDAIRSHDDGTSSIDPDHAVGAFYEHCPSDAAERAVARLRPMDGGSTLATSRGTPWRDVDSTYVVCRHDEAIPAVGQTHMAEKASRILTLDTDHSPFLSQPTETAQILIELARAV